MNSEAQSQNNSSAASKATEVIHCQQLSKSYQIGPEQLRIITDLNLRIDSSELVAILGSSGSGKSTLLNLLGGLDSADSGSVSIMGTDISQLSENERAQLRNQKIGFVYQFHHLLREFSALENIAMPLLIAGQKQSTAYQQAQKLLEQVGLSQRSDHKPAQLSGGERQRVAIARALVANPNCVLMDEPTGNLDQANTQEILLLINQLSNTFGTAFVVVTHDQQIANTMHRCLYLKDGQLQNQ